LSLQKAQPTYEMKAPWTDPGLRELFALSMLASFGCGLALAVDDLLFAAIFAAAIDGSLWSRRASWPLLSD
jgi:hypothetical protein